jgi:Skp family chaperone for outer membrane proteins
MKLLLVIMILLSSNVYSQNDGFINSDSIYAKFPEALQAQQKIQIMTEKWKHELDSMQKNIDNLEIEINKNRTVWTETELQIKEAELINFKKAREDYAKSIFEPNGKYDLEVVKIFKPVDEKINLNLKQLKTP